jgi:hypothetical protein
LHALGVAHKGGTGTVGAVGPFSVEGFAQLARVRSEQVRPPQAFEVLAGKFYQASRSKMCYGEEVAIVGHYYRIAVYGGLSPGGAAQRFPQGGPKEGFGVDFVEIIDDDRKALARVATAVLPKLQEQAGLKRSIGFVPDVFLVEIEVKLRGALYAQYVFRVAGKQPR